MSPNRAAPNLGDPLQMAVEVTQIKGTLALMQREVSSGMQTVSSQLAALQGEMRDLGKVTGEVSKQQQAMESHSEGLARAFAEITRLANDNATWRERHERENRDVADKVTTFRGVLLGFGLLAMLTVSMAVWAVNDGFHREQQARAVLEAKHDREIRTATEMIQENRKQVREIQDTRKLQ